MILAGTADHTGPSLFLIDREQVSGHIPTLFFAQVHVWHVGAGLAMGRLVEPFLHVLRGVLVPSIEKIISAVPMGERWCTLAFRSKNTGYEVARAAGPHLHALSTCLGVAASEPGSTREIEITKPVASRRSRNKSQQNENRRFLPRTPFPGSFVLVHSSNRWSLSEPDILQSS